MNLRQLEQFLAVAESGSFSKGALRAHVSQPALSTAIAKLENEFGVQLFSRLARQVTLTAEGYQLLSKAKMIIGECEAVRSSMKQTTEREVLSIGVCDTLHLPPLAAILEQFRRNHGGIRLKVLELDSTLAIERLCEGKLNLAYVAQTGNVHIPENLQTRRIALERYVIATARDHRFTGQKTIPMAALDGLPFIARTHCEYRNLLGMLWSEENIRPKIIYRTSQDQRALELVRAGLGVSVFPKSLVSGDLQAIDFEEHKLEREILCCWSKENLSPAQKNFLHFADI